MNIATLLHEQANAQPDKLAIVDSRYHQTLTFSELEQASSRAATLLLSVGLKAGDAVLIFQPMSAQLYVALLAIFRLGMVAMFLDPAAGRQHTDRCCALNLPAALIASSRAHLLRLRSIALRQIPHKFAIGLPVPGAKRWQQTLPPDAAITDCDADTPALLTFTSGSTGLPKAALRSHGFLIAQHRALARSLCLTSGQLDLTTLPIFVLANLASGVTSLIPPADLRFPGKINAAQVIAQIQAYQPHSTAASPAFLAQLAEHCLRQGLTLSNFDRIFSGGAPVFPQLLDELQQLAPRATVSAVYGSTEAEPIAHISRQQMQPADLAAMQTGKGLLVGTPVREIHLRILPNSSQPLPLFTAESFAAACLPRSQVGEIVVSGDHVLSSYLHGQGNESIKFQVANQRWHRTGDAGYLDIQGRLWLMGRCHAQIADADGVLYPFAVEVAAHAHPGVRRTALVQHRGQRVLVVELKPNRSPTVLKSLKSDLAWAKIERYICAVIPVDRRHNAKVDYPTLQQQLEKLEKKTQKISRAE